MSSNTKNKLKVALCFSGQLRTWRDTFRTWKYLFYDAGNPACSKWSPEAAEGSPDIIHHTICNGQDIKIDYFMHTWDYDTPSTALGGNLKDGATLPGKTIYDATEFEELKAIVQPRSFVVQEAVDFRPLVNACRDKPAIWDTRFISQFYSMMRSANLKRDFEIENKFEYDIVIKMRYDLHVSQMYPIPTFIDPRKLYSIHHGREHFMYRIGDIHFLCDSQTYDVVCDFYRNIWSIPQRFFQHYGNQVYYNENVFYYYAKKLGLEVQHFNSGVSIKRPKDWLDFAKGLYAHETI